VLFASALGLNTVLWRKQTEREAFGRHAGEKWSLITRLGTRTKESIECASVVVSNQSSGVYLLDVQRTMKVKG